MMVSLTARVLRFTLLSCLPLPYERTRPPDKVGVTQSTAADYINWAEYISYRNSRLRDDMQYLLVDPTSGIFASVLELPNRKPKATYDAAARAQIVATAQRPPDRRGHLHCPAKWSRAVDHLRFHSRQARSCGRT